MESGGRAIKRWFCKKSYAKEGKTSQGQVFNLMEKYFLMAWLLRKTAVLRSKMKKYDLKKTSSNQFGNTHERQFHVESSALVHLRFKINIPFEAFDDALADGEAKSRARVFGGKIR